MTESLTLSARPQDAATTEALPPSQWHDGEVHIVISPDAYHAHRIADDWEWTPAVDEPTGREIEVRKDDCGAGCRCAMAVRLT